MDGGGKFSVFTSSYVNTALNQSAIGIHKFYVTTIHKLHYLTIKLNFTK